MLRSSTKILDINFTSGENIIFTAIFSVAWLYLNFCAVVGFVCVCVWFILVIFYFIVWSDRHLILLFPLSLIY